MRAALALAVNPSPSPSSTAAPTVPAADSVRLDSLTIRDFRNIAEAALKPPPAGLVIVGDNGQGKTNLLEAAYYFMLLRSARGARDADLIRFGCAGFFLAAALEGGSALEMTIGYERQGRRKRVRMDGVEIPRLSDALGALPAVMVSPRDVSLVTGSPAERRRFMDVVLAVSSKGYLRALQQYRRALARRNAALRDVLRAGGKVDEDMVAVWEPALAEHGATLWAGRVDWLAGHADRYAALCGSIGEPGAPALRLVGTPPGAADHSERQTILRDALASRRVHDLRRGVTSTGPHRDDLFLTLDDRDLRTFGSAGQQRTAAMALRLLEAESLRAHVGAPPLMLMDDPFAELDTRRSERILALLDEAGLGQVLLAVPRVADIPGEFTRLDRCGVREGRLVAAPPPARAREGGGGGGPVVEGTVP